MAVIIDIEIVRRRNLKEVLHFVLERFVRWRLTERKVDTIRNAPPRKNS